MSASKYHLQAEAIRKQAAKVREPSVREQLLLMAADWERLARDAEELERRSAAFGARQTGQAGNG